ncbi:MAG TPA: carbamoyl-phosphate synthase large subunit [Candidatus Limnocylindrales bacterium]|nr:carbamoyl-phosphate synthase large subunit [Candidatus Limnocylindrales bacterium]
MTDSERPQSVLIVGSGPVIIGQAAEFDYAGTQACRALRDEGVRTILLNSNPATIMTDPGVADVVYLEPITVASVERILERERPDGILCGLGGQTALNLAVALDRAGTLERHGVRLLGTPLAAIEMAEDRQRFRQLLDSIGQPYPGSEIVEGSTPAERQEASRRALQAIGLPAVIRPAYTLGGSGGGIVSSEAEYFDRVRSGLRASPIGQVIVERYLDGWQEVEYEVMRDADDTCIAVCSMENVDPLGVHTGDSIVVAPVQTLSDAVNQRLRSAALAIIRALGVEGGCNVQFALSADHADYAVIEVNPRVSRSSALASKATGYPIARVAAQIAIGRRLAEIPNAITGTTVAAFEPALDYVVVKLPRFPFDKFPGADRGLGSQMKATGEVMAIDRTFGAALNKALRGLEQSGSGFLAEEADWAAEIAAGDLRSFLRSSDSRLWRLLACLRRGVPPDEIQRATGIAPWFVSELGRLVGLEKRLREVGEMLSDELLATAKRASFGDRDIAALTGIAQTEVTSHRYGIGLRPGFAMVDTSAAEFPAETPYFYSTYAAAGSPPEAPPVERPAAVVIGSGPVRIGQGIEFDYCAVQAADALRRRGWQALMVNSNPETVSTDFDASSRLYFESLDVESVSEVFAAEADPETGQRPPAMTQFGGQTPLGLAQALAEEGTELLGLDLDTIDVTEERTRFAGLVERLGIHQPEGGMAASLDEALVVAERVGYPVIVRPSYVIGGLAIGFAYGPEDLARLLARAAAVDQERPVRLDAFLEGMEVDVDAVCDGETVLVPGLIEHVERAGVHSGDSIGVFPPQRIGAVEQELVVESLSRLARAIGVRGLVNAQFIVRDDGVYLIEVNPRASRTVPFISKVTGVPMIELATRVALGERLADMGWADGLRPSRALVAVKAPVFSTAKLRGVDPMLGPAMQSTGEVIGLHADPSVAMAKAMVAASLNAPLPGRYGAVALLSIADRDKHLLGELAERLSRAGYRFCATSGTARALAEIGFEVETLLRVGEEGDGRSVLEAIGAGDVLFVVNTPSPGAGPVRDAGEIRKAALAEGIACLTAIDTALAAAAALDPRVVERLDDVRPLEEWLVGVAAAAR